MNRGGGPVDLPLKAAVAGGHEEMVRLLLSLGANVNGWSPGTSPLLWALLTNRIELARILIEVGADTKAVQADAEERRMPHIVAALKRAMAPAPSKPPEKVIPALEANWDDQDMGNPRPTAEQPTELEVQRAVAALTDRLAKNPRDVPSILLCGSFVISHYGLPESARPPESSPCAGHQSAQAALDRVLVEDPRNAQALYYKALLHGARIDGPEASTRREQAVALLRRAVEAAPRNTHYRRLLALYLADQGQPGEATKILRASNKNDAMIPLLDDLEQLSAPAGAHFLPRHILSISFVLEMDGAGIQNSGLRVRTYQRPHSGLSVLSGNGQTER